MQDGNGDSPCIRGLPDYKYLLFRRQATSQLPPALLYKMHMSHPGDSRWFGPRVAAG